MWFFAFFHATECLLRSISALRHSKPSTLATLFTFVVLYVVLAIFVYDPELNKNHLAWVIPATWFAAGTRFGRQLASYVAVVLHKMMSKQ